MGVHIGVHMGVHIGVHIGVHMMGPAIVPSQLVEIVDTRKM